MTGKVGSINVHPLRKLRKEFREAFKQALKSGQRKGIIDKGLSGPKAFHPCPQPPSKPHHERKVKNNLTGKRKALQEKVE